MRIFQRGLNITVLSGIFFMSLFGQLSDRGRDEPYTLMWDLGGTLVDVHWWSFCQEVGLWDFGLYYLFDARCDKDLFLRRMFQVLEILGGAQQGPENFKSKHNGVTNLPAHMHHWLSGKYDRDPEAFVKKLEQGIDELFEQGFFTNKREYRLIRRAVRLIFDPNKLIHHQKIHRPLVKMLEKISCAGVHKNMILSNWDAASFDLFLQTPIGQELSQFIDPDAMVISGRIFLTKPHPDFFAYVLKTYKLHHKNCIFIDNDPVNCAMAQSLGIKTIHFTGDVAAVKKTLKDLKIL